MRPEDFVEPKKYRELLDQNMKYPWRYLQYHVIDQDKFHEAITSTASNDFIVDWFILQAERGSDKVSYVATAAAQLAVFLDRHRNVR